MEQRSKASDPKQDDLHPTSWKGPLAFVREYGSEKEPRQIVDQWPTADTRRSERLPGVPEAPRPSSRFRHRERGGGSETFIEDA